MVNQVTYHVIALQTASMGLGKEGSVFIVNQSKLTTLRNVPSPFTRLTSVADSNLS